MIKKLMMDVIEVKKIALDTYEMTLQNDYVCEHAEPGQFLHIAVPHHTLRRPISISSIHRERQEAKIIFKTVGEGTEQLTRFQAGDVLDVLGPSGNGYPIAPNTKSVLLIGGGVGVPPL